MSVKNVWKFWWSTKSWQTADYVSSFKTLSWCRLPSSASPSLNHLESKALSLQRVVGSCVKIKVRWSYHITHAIWQLVSVLPACVEWWGWGRWNCGSLNQFKLLRLSIFLGHPPLIGQGCAGNSSSWHSSSLSSLPSTWWLQRNYRKLSFMLVT